MDQEVRREGNFQYIEVGEGPVLIVLHGLFGALSNFNDVLHYFSDRYKVVIPLMPIYELPVADTNVKRLSAFVREFVTYKGFDKFTLLGNSLGGHVSLVYTSLYPEQVNRLILTGSSGLYENSMGGSFPRREDHEFIRKKVEFTFYDPANATKELVDEVYAIINDKEKLIRILSLAKSAIRHNMTDELGRMKLPVCLIWGRNDNITPPDVAEEFHRLLNDSELFWIDECGHAPMMEKPKEFNAILDKWLCGS